MSAALAFLGTRAGSIVAMVLGGLLAAGVLALGITLWLTRSDLADARLRADTLESAVKLQNDEVMDWQAKAAAAQSAASARALDKLKPRPKPATATIQDLNRWIAQP